MTTRTLVVVSAGLGVPSSTRLLADRLAAAARTRMEQDRPDRPVEVVVVELRDLATEIAHRTVSGFTGTALRDALEAVSQADALIVATPMFNASYSGLFKSFFDVLNADALTGKPVLIAATGGSARHSLALEHAVRPLFSFLRAQVAPTAVHAASEDWGQGGGRHTDPLGERVERAAGELAAMVGHRPDVDATPEQVTPFAQQLAAVGARPPGEGTGRPAA
ncbi:NAD(P)H-dependent oxidoreductase [Streptomyces sp. 549]|uniref:CE1759 family FMN reductase n=1 Tax=Streptomyces sp. 549 TaxID=3049076 RepID=UPI0024C450B6|nr:CE1759 family FMN reductase [Streptomyces sp. 549]MDK1474648.1 NAD(P)H-dependent oxidoreductase [Streptomyces sp. 549]